jgi:hypothetical protein
MELSHRLVDHGFKVTFVCTEPIHALVLDAPLTATVAMRWMGSAWSPYRTAWPTATTAGTSASFWTGSRGAYRATWRS